MREENCRDVFCSLIIGRWSGGIRVVAVGDCIRFALWWRITIGRFISIRKRKRWRSCSKVYRLISDNKDIASRVKCRSSITFLIYIYRGCACCVMFFFSSFLSLFAPFFWFPATKQKKKPKWTCVIQVGLCLVLSISISMDISHYILRPDLKWEKGKKKTGWERWWWRHLISGSRYYQSMSIRRDQDPLFASSPGSSLS